MSAAQVTEAHREIARRITGRTNQLEHFAQLIADSEARACAELRAELDAQCLLNAKGSEREAVLLRRVDRMAKERDQLRAEIALLREWQREVIQNANAHHVERKDAIARAERAEAELATERARLDWLEDHGWITGEPCDRAAIDAAMKEGA